MGALAGRVAAAPPDRRRVPVAAGPMERVAAPLRQMGAAVSTTDGHAPVTVRGARPLRALDHDLPVASAQVLGAVTLAALAADGRTTITTPGPDPRPHRAAARLARRAGRTRRLHDHASTGRRASRRATSTCPATSRRPPSGWPPRRSIPTPSCASAASASTPAAPAIIDVLREMGADIEVVGRRSDAAPEPVGDLVVRGGAAIRGIRIDGARVADLIDELPLLAIAMAAADGPSELRDAGELRVKESDRIALVVDGLQAIGVDAEELPDGWRVTPRGRTRRPAGSATIETGGDHRIAMAFAIAALTGVADGVAIDDPACAEVSYPGFWADLAPADRRRRVGRGGRPMNRLRLLTAGESHGPGMSGILDGLPAGLRVSTREVDRDLARRQHGYGSGRRMLIERDRVDVDRGPALRADARLAPRLHHREPATGRAGPSGCRSSRSRRRRRPKPITLARPGHADLAGAIKYDTPDIRDVLERASARSTAPRVAAGAVCRQLLAGVRRHGLELRRPAGPHPRLPRRGRPARPHRRRLVAARPRRPDAPALPGPGRRGGHDGRGGRGHRGGRLDRRQLRGRRRGDAHRRGLQRRVGHAARHGAGRRDHGHPGGQGRRDRPRLRGRSRGAAARSTTRSTRRDRPGAGASNRAGGVEGGMSNGEPIVVRAAVKPVATLRKPLDSVDLATGQPGRAHIERSDVAILPRAAVVGEAMVALVLADALLATFGGDTMGDVLAAVRRRRARSRGPAGRGAAPAAAGRTALAALPDDAAAEATPVPGHGRVTRSAPVPAARPGHRLLRVARDDGGRVRGARAAAHATRSADVAAAGPAGRGRRACVRRTPAAPT